jgi:hypothetical protein
MSLRRRHLLLLGLMSMPWTGGAAQPGPAGREVVLTGAPGERPAPVYGAAHVPVVLVFDADLGKEIPFLAGAEVRRHPSLSNALEVIPSPSLAGMDSALLRVSLTNGAVALVLVFGAERRDQVVRIFRRPALALDGGTAPGGAEVQDAFRLAASAVFGERTCRPPEPGLPEAEEVMQPSGADTALVCAVGAVSYLRVRRAQPECPVSSARLLRERRAVEVLLLEEVRPCLGGKCQALVVRTPLEESSNLELELLAADGTLCEPRLDVTLRPGAP